MEAAEAQALQVLWRTQPLAALATLHRGEPAVSMVPFALLPQGGGVVLHVSRLATHTQDMLAHPNVALLVTASLESAALPLALARASLQGRARPVEPESAQQAQARAAYAAKLPQAEALFEFPDFSFFVVEPESLRYVAGFGRAFSFTAQRLSTLWSELA